MFGEGPLISSGAESNEEEVIIRVPRGYKLTRKGEKYATQNEDKGSHLEKSLQQLRMFHVSI